MHAANPGTGKGWFIQDRGYCYTGNARLDAIIMRSGIKHKHHSAYYRALAFAHYYKEEHSLKLILLRPNPNPLRYDADF
jgi:DNA polymerase III epsilon subunit-like protein